MFFSCSNRNIKGTESKKERPKGLISMNIKMLTILLQGIDTRHSFEKLDQGFSIKPTHINTDCIFAIGETFFYYTDWYFLLHLSVSKHESCMQYFV